MFYNSNAFRLLEGGVQLNQLQQEMHAHNIANLETPNFKAKSLQFTDVLTRTQEGKQTVTELTAQLTQDDALSLRPDGNNVDYEAESLGLYKTYVTQSILLTKVKQEFSKYNAVLNNNMK